MTGEMIALANPWEQIKARLTTRVSARAYEDWVTRTAFDGSEGGILRVTVPDQVTKTWMEQEYAEDIRETIRELNLPVERVVYTTQPTGATMSPAGQSQEPLFASPASQLNRKFRFDNFVVGSCNQFAHAAARAVANSPSRTYNPLFIYGGSGMGKTHLMHSIGTALAEQYASMRIVYTSSERFMNEMINCIKTDRMPAFHRYYRSADVLLIDDIHILAGKERTQEEFFHTFNELYEHQKQIVVSSDSTPKSTPGLVDRLRSRFEWAGEINHPRDRAEAAGADQPAERLRAAVEHVAREVGRERLVGLHREAHRREQQQRAARRQEAVGVTEARCELCKPAAGGFFRRPRRGADHQQRGDHRAAHQAVQAEAPDFAEAGDHRAADHRADEARAVHQHRAEGDGVGQVLLAADQLHQLRLARGRVEGIDQAEHEVGRDQVPGLHVARGDQRQHRQRLREREALRDQQHLAFPAPVHPDAGEGAEHQHRYVQREGSRVRAGKAEAVRW